MHTFELIIRTYIYYEPIFFLCQLHLVCTLFAIIEIILCFLYLTSPFLVKHFDMPVWHPANEVTLHDLEMMAAQVNM